MPFLDVFTDAKVHLQYFVSTPSFHTFRRIPSSAADFGAGSQESLPERDELLPDPAYPIVLFLPSESLACVRLYAGQLRDERLADRFNLVAVDTRVHGLSTGIDTVQKGSTHEYDLDTKTSDVLEFISSLCLKACGSKEWPAGVHLVGSSLSGLVCLRVAAQRPQLVLSVTYLSPLRELESEENIESWTTVSDAMMVTDDLQNELLGGFAYRWGGDSRRPIPPQILLDLRDTWKLLTTQENGREAARLMWFSINWHRTIIPDAVIAQIKCPVMVAEGTENLPYDEPCGELLRQRLVNVSKFNYVPVPQAPFLLSVTHPSEAANLIVWHLDNYEPPSDNATDATLSSLALLSIDSEQSKLLEAAAAGDGPQRFPPGISRAEAQLLVSMLATLNPKLSRSRTEQLRGTSWGIDDQTESEYDSNED